MVPKACSSRSLGLSCAHALPVATEQPCAPCPAGPQSLEALAKGGDALGHFASRSIPVLFSSFQARYQSMLTLSRVVYPECLHPSTCERPDPVYEFPALTRRPPL